VFRCHVGLSTPFGPIGSDHQNFGTIFA
jgi:hypothetical protein